MSVSVPFPVYEAVRAIYGAEFATPDPDWIWDVSPFVTGYCQERLHYEMQYLISIHKTVL